MAPSCGFEIGSRIQHVICSQEVKLTNTPTESLAQPDFSNPTLIAPFSWQKNRVALQIKWEPHESGSERVSIALSKRYRNRNVGGEGGLITVLVLAALAMFIAGHPLGSRIVRHAHQSAAGDSTSYVRDIINGAALHRSTSSELQIGLLLRDIEELNTEEPMQTLLSPQTQ
jgi:hypothetical protein